MQQVLRFGGVGSVGFVVDGGLLWVLISAGVNPYLARIFSFPLAVLMTWLLNRIWTFSSVNRARPGRQLNRYLAIQIVGAIGNYAIYAILLKLVDPTPENALAALAFGAIGGMFINFVGSKYFVFSNR